MKTRILYVLTIVTLMFVPVAATAAPEPAAQSRPVAQEGADARTYLLELSLPEHVPPAGVASSEVPGHVYAALDRQWMQVEGVLQAFQERGLVETYTLLPKANAFRIRAKTEVKTQLDQLGTLSEAGPRAQTVAGREEQLQPRLETAVQAAQEGAAPLSAPKAPLLVDEKRATAAMAATAEPVVPTVDYLVQLAAGGGRLRSSARREIEGYIDWLRGLGDVESYEWLPEADAFRVSARADLSSLREQPVVAAVTLYGADGAQESGVQVEESAPTETESAAVPLSPAELQASTSTTPTVRTQLFSRDVRATSDTNATAVFTLTNEAGVVKDVATICPDSAVDPGCDYSWWSSGSGWYKEITFRSADVLRPGDVLRVHQEGQDAFGLAFPDLTAVVDRDADTVSGQAPAGVSSTDPDNPPNLYAQVRGVNKDAGSWQTLTEPLTTDANGRYTTVFTYTSPTIGTLDLRSPLSEEGYLRYVGSGGNEVRLAFHVPEVQVRVHDDWVVGNAGLAGMLGATVDVTLKSIDGAIKGRFTEQVAPDGAFGGRLQDQYDNPVSSAPGDTVEMVTGYATSVSVPVVELTARADPAADTVTGVAPPNITVTDTNFVTLPGLTVDLWEQAFSEEWVTTDAAGNYTADDVGSFDPGEDGVVRYYNENGDQVFLNFRAPVVYVRGHYGWGYQGDAHVSGYQPMGDVPVELELQRDGSIIGTASDVADDEGFYFVYFEDIYGHPVDIRGGDTVEVRAGGRTETVDVPEFDVASDPDTDTVSGSTTASVITDTYGLNQTLTLWPDDLRDNAAPRSSVIPDASGDFSAVFLNAVDPGDEGHLRYINADGQRIYDDFQAPRDVIIHVRGWREPYYYEYSAYVAENYVQIESPGCGTVHIAVKDSTGVLKADDLVYACRQADTFLTDEYGIPVDIEGGDTVEATFDGRTSSLVVPSFDVTSDPETDAVYGITDVEVATDDMLAFGEPQTLAVWPHSVRHEPGRLTKNVAVDASGAFTAANPFYYRDYRTMDWVMGGMGIWPGDTGHLRYIDASENRIYARFQAPGGYVRPQLFVRGDGSGYRGDDYVRVLNPGCGDVDLVLRNAIGAVKAEMSVVACKNARIELNEDIEGGDTLEATAGGRTTVVTVPSFEVTSDDVNDRVIGTTDADVVTDTFQLNRTLAVWPESYWDSYPGKHVLPDAGGVFTAANPFYDRANPAQSAVTLDWEPGQLGQLRYVDANRNRVYDSFAALLDEPEIHVRKDGNSVWGYVTEANVPVTVTLESGTAVKAIAHHTADSDGRFVVRFYDAAGDPVTIEEGNDVVIERPEAPAITVPVVHLTGQADTALDTVSGEAPVDSAVNVIVEGNMAEDQSVSTDSTGAYSADFTGFEDIEPGDSVMIQHLNAEGHYVSVAFHAGPKLHAQLGGYYAWGYSTAANQPVTLMLKDSDGTVKATGTDVSSASNTFSVYFLTAAGRRVLLEAGDVVEADFGDGDTAAMTVSGITARVDADANLVSGTGPANDRLAVQVDRFRGTVNTDGEGNWSVDVSDDVNVQPGDQATVRHLNADHNETWLYAVAPVVYVRGSGSGATAYVADNYVSGWAPGRSLIDVTLRRDGDTVATRRLVYGGHGGPVHYSVSLTDALDQAADIRGGDEVVVSGSLDETVDVPRIDAEVDADSDIMIGTTSLVDEVLGVSIGGEDQTVPTDGDGDFVATFDDIQSWEDAYVRHRNADGHWIHARFQPETAGEVFIYGRWDADDDDVCRSCVSGYASASGIVASVALRRKGSVVATATGRAGYDRVFSVAFTDVAGEDIPIENGDVIEVTSGGDPVAMTMADLTVQANAASNTLFGTGPAGQRLSIRGECAGSTTVDPDGSWLYDDCDKGVFGSGYVFITDERGHRTYLSWAVPSVYVREHGNTVGGRVEPGARVVVTLKRGAAERAVAETTSGTYNGSFDVTFLDAVGDPLIINANDTVLVETSQTTTVPVTPLSAEVDTGRDWVIGSGPPNAELTVQAGGCNRVVWTDDTGDFVADVSGDCDLRAGDTVRINYWNDEANLVYVSFNAPLVRVNTVNDIADGYATPNAAADVTLRRGGSLLATATAFTQVGGWFSTFFTDATGDLVDIQPGDTVTVSASPTVEATLADLSASVNIAADTVTGSGPPDTLLFVKVFWTGDWWATMSKSVTTDEDGAFTADFSDEMDLTDLSYAYVRYDEGDGQTSIHTVPARLPILEDAERAIEAQGGVVGASAFGVANGGDLTPPLTYRGGGPGRTVFASAGGVLVITWPDGSVETVRSNRFAVEDAPKGEWKVQVGVSGVEGDQYAVAAGQAAYVTYLPLIPNGAVRYVRYFPVILTGPRSIGPAAASTAR